MALTSHYLFCSVTVQMELNVSQPWLGHITRGVKTVEGRLNKGKFAALKVGSALVIGGNTSAGHPAKRTVAVVCKVVKYASFEEYLSQEGLAKTLPGTKTIKEGVAVYRQFYTIEQEKEHGILAIHIVKC